MELEDIVNEEMLTTEDVNNMLEHTDKGRTKQTIRNCVTVLQNDPVLKKAIKRNELSGRMDIVKEVPWERRSESLTVTDTDDSNLKMYLEDNYEITSERVIKKGVDIVSNENKYHPIRDYLESLTWDGVPRIENLLPRFLGAEKNSYTTGVMKMHMLAAISRIYEPGIKYDIMLCLVGSQGAGKSTFFKYLAINDDWFSDNLDHLDDENIYRKLQNHWIIEMGEMKATVTAKNIEQIKSFLSRQKAPLRRFSDAERAGVDEEPARLCDHAGFPVQLYAGEKCLRFGADHRCDGYFIFGQCGWLLYRHLGQ